MKKRIFVAAAISSELQKEILEWGKEHEELPVRWLAGKNLHITLIPPWYADDIESVIEKLRTIKGQPFDIEFNKVTYGPGPERPRLIWAEGGAPAEIRELKIQLEKLLNKEPEKRTFTLHLTIARFRPETFVSFQVKKLDEKVAWHEKISSIVLMEAHLSSKGADYEILSRFTLSGGSTSKSRIRDSQSESGETLK